MKTLDADNSRTISRSEFVKAEELLKKLFGEGSDALKAEFADTPYDGYVNNLALRDDEGLLGQAISTRQTQSVLNILNSMVLSELD